MPIDNLDFFLHKRRLCVCNCRQCEERLMHPVVNCRDCCEVSESQLLQDFALDESKNEICRCNCKFCRSGVTVAVHLVMDCLLHCEHTTLIRA